MGDFTIGRARPRSCRSGKCSTRLSTRRASNGISALPTFQSSSVKHRKRRSRGTTGPRLKSASTSWEPRVASLQRYDEVDAVLALIATIVIGWLLLKLLLPRAAELEALCPP